MTATLVVLLWPALLQTLYMVAVAMVFAVLFGLPLGVLLFVTDRGQILGQVPLNRLLGSLINMVRSVPALILMVAITPFTRLLVGTSIGTHAAVVPLSVAAIPFLARIVESALREVDYGVVEAAQSVGATPLQIIRRVLLPEARPALVLGLTITAVNLIGYSAIAGTIGGGGLGDLAIRYGFYRFRGDVMLATVIVLVVLVQAVQMSGDALARRVRH